jgi:hypothetical protein
MSEDARMAAMDARLRRAMSGLDAGRGFDERLRARIAAAGPRMAPGAEFEHQRQVLRRLRREAWANGISLAGLGLAAAATAWRFAPEIERMAAGAVDPALVGAATLAVIAAGLLPLLRRMPGLRLR